MLHERLQLEERTHQAWLESYDTKTVYHVKLWDLSPADLEVQSKAQLSSGLGQKLNQTQTRSYDL